MENQKIRIDLSQAPWLTCECGNELFTPAVMFKKLSMLVSPTGKEENYPVEVVICTKCGKIPSFVGKMIPEHLKAKESDNTTESLGPR